MDVHFRSKYPWALVPDKPKVDRRTPQEDAEIYADSFRWVRKSRVPEACWPWRVAQELGWIVRSPVDVHMTPITDIELACPPDEFDLLERSSGLSELWKRDSTFLALNRTSWLRLYDYRTKSGFSAMFVPNGAGTVEWHLGFEVHIPEGYYLLTLPLSRRPKGLEVPMGIFDSKTLEKVNNGPGMSIAARPRRSVRIRRRQPIARIVLIHADSIKATATVTG